MINLKKQDPVADAVKDILQQEALKGNQHKIDKNKNNKIDAEDFKLLRKEEEVQEGVTDTLKKVAKKVGQVLGGPDDEGHRKDLQRKMGIPQTGKPSMAKQNEETELEEGWDDMVKAAKDSVKSGPKPSGGSGVKLGTRYGGGKQKDKPEQDEKKETKESVELDERSLTSTEKSEMEKNVKGMKKNFAGFRARYGDRAKEVMYATATKQAKNEEVQLEGKQPDADVPFEAPYNTTSKPATVTDKSGAKHTPMSRVKDLARRAMKRVTNDLNSKTGK